MPQLSNYCQMYKQVKQQSYFAAIKRQFNGNKNQNVRSVFLTSDSVANICFTDGILIAFLVTSP